jgi:hypothetical protein
MASGQIMPPVEALDCRKQLPLTPRTSATRGVIIATSLGGDTQTRANNAVDVNQ